MILFLVLAISSLGFSACQEDDVTIWRLEQNLERRIFEWCNPTPEGDCSETLHMVDAHRLGFLGISTEDFEVLVKEYRRLKREAGEMNLQMEPIPILDRMIQNKTLVMNLEVGNDERNKTQNVSMDRQSTSD